MAYKFFPCLFLGILFSYTLKSQEGDCLNRPIVRPSLSALVRQNFEEKLALAKTDYDQNPTDADALIWYGRRTAYLGQYEAAIALYTEGGQKHPTDARFLRHRGHRYLTLRCFDKAIADFEKAAQLTKGKADVIEPDGLPNAQNKPTSTLQTNIYYHLGLAYYLKRDYGKALKAYQTCLALSKNPDMYVATANWLYITYRQMGKTRQAARLLKTISADMNLIENEGYLDLLLLHKGVKKAADFEKAITKMDALADATLGFGLGIYYRLNQQEPEAQRIFKTITAGSQWSSFGFIAAEAALYLPR
jgi:tetratricopeptide (TPR) repeat protein